MMEESAAEIQPLTSREVLDGLILFLCPVIVVLQWAVFLFVRWESVEYRGFRDAYTIAWSINPWIVWLAVLVLGFSILAWWNARRLAKRTKWAWTTWLCTVLAIALAAYGFTLTPPPMTHYNPDHSPMENPDKLPFGSPLEY